MPSLTLASSSVDFGVCQPGPQPAQYVALSVSTDQPLKVTIALASASNAGFTGTLCFKSTQISIHGGAVGVSETDSASTSGTNNTVTFQSSTPANPTPVQGGNFVRVDFSPPATPVPEAWSGLITLSWPGGSTQLSLTGTTAQLGLKVTSAQPVAITPGDSATIALQVEYDTVDAAPVSVNVGPSTNTEFPELAGLGIPTKPVSLPPTYIAATTPKGGQILGGPIVVGRPTNEVTLNVHRVVSVDFPVSAAKTINPGNNQAAYLVLSAPSLPTEIAGPAYYKVLFNIPPMPVTVTPQAGPIYLLAGVAIQIQLKIAAAGAQTTLEFGAATAAYQTAIPGGGPLTGSPGLTIAAVNTGIGSGTKNAASVKVSAPANALGGVVSLSLPWTAYNGLLKGTVTVQVSLLPASVIYKGSINYAKLTGSWQWGLNAKGYSYFTGNVHVPASEILAQQYAVGVSLSATNPSGKKLTVVHSGTLGSPVVGTALGNDSDSWSDAGIWNGPNGWINTKVPATALAAWAKICTASVTANENYSPDALDTVVGALVGILPVEVVVAAIVVAVDVAVTCAISYAKSEIKGSLVGSVDCSSGDPADPDYGDGGDGGDGGDVGDGG